MLPGWDKLQDMRRIPVATVPKPPEPIEAKLIVDREALDRGADNIVAARVLTNIARNRNMSLLGKMQHLTESAQDFHKKTESTLDGIAAKIETAKEKRDEAAAAHHAYYDTIIKGVEDSIAVIDRLSNGPLHGDGGS